MNVIITGSTGFLAHHLINEIKSKKPNWLLYGADIKNTNNQLTNFTMKNLNDKKKWIEYLKDKNPEIIFHLIGTFEKNDERLDGSLTLKADITYVDAQDKILKEKDVDLKKSQKKIFNFLWNAAI